MVDFLSRGDSLQKAGEMGLGSWMLHPMHTKLDRKPCGLSQPLRSKLTFGASPDSMQLEPNCETTVSAPTEH